MGSEEGLGVSIEDLIRAAKGEVPVDLLLENVNYVNLFTGEVYEASVGVFGDRVAFVDSGGEYKARERIDCRGLYAIPGLIDSHLHIESSMVVPSRFAEAVLPHGVTTVAIDPHEIANVMGKEGVRLMIEGSRGLPLRVYVMVPTCVPSLPGAETAGADLDAGDIEEMLGWERVIGLAEMMDFEGVVNLHERAREIVKVGRRLRKLMDGHTFLHGLQLNAYIAAGMEADHENFTFQDGLEKLRLGMYMKIRLPYLLDAEEFVAGIKNLPSPRRLIFVTDDCLPDNLVRDGHLDYVVRTFIEHGMDPVEAIRAATITPATHLRLYELGAVSPGKFADIVLLGSLEKFDVRMVFAGGRLVARDGRMVAEVPLHRFPENSKKTVKVRGLSLDHFRIKAPEGRDRVRVRVIDLGEPDPASNVGQEFLQTLITRFSVREFPVKDGYIDTQGEAVITVIERHGRSGNVNKGIVGNTGMRRGAVASTVAHDSHNLVVMGVRPEDMLAAARRVVENQGGVVVVDDGRVLAEVELPVAGLMSEEPVERVAEKFRKVREAMRSIGLRDHPYMPVFFLLTLPVIPNAKITDKYLYDVLGAKPVELIVE